MNPRRRAAVCLTVTLFTVTLAALAQAAAFGGWTAATSVEATPGTSPALNTSALEGCPSVAKDDTSLYFASTRAGGLGGLDIWVSTRSDADAGWGAPVNLGAPVNTAADEFCPTPLRNGHGFLFVSTKPGGCGGADMYATRRHVKRGWADPENLGCRLNSAADEASPFLVGDELWFSSTRAGGFSAEPAGAIAGDSDLYVASVANDDGAVSGPILAPDVNTAQSEARPNLRRDGRELFFDSNRPGGLGLFDLWSSVRDADGSWSAPHNLGATVNSAAGETRPSLSWDGTALYFGSTRAGGEGSSDLYLTTRDRRLP